MCLHHVILSYYFIIICISILSLIICINKVKDYNSICICNLHFKIDKFGLSIF